MAYTPTTNLSLPIITTGTESGTWGDVVDNGLTAYLDIAIAGGLAIAITTADVTLTKTAGTNATTGIVSTTAQYAILNISGAKTGARNLNLPITSKWYIINNAAATGGFSLTVRGVTPTTGVTLVDGEKAIVAWNGSDFVKIASSVITNSTGTLSAANGGTGAATLTANNVVLGNGTSAVQFVAPSTNGNVLTSNGTTWTSATPAVGYAGVAATAFTASGTFTIPTGITRVKISVVGGGGGSGGSYVLAGCPPTNNAGGAAAGGGVAISYLSGLVSGNLTITVGAVGTNGTGGNTVPTSGTGGGTSSVASGTNNTITTVQATGGSGGTAATSFAVGTAGTAGVGSGSTISLNIYGTPSVQYAPFYGGHFGGTSPLKAGYVLIEY